MNKADEIMLKTIWTRTKEQKTNNWTEEQEAKFNKDFEEWINTDDNVQKA